MKETVVIIAPEWLRSTTNSFTTTTASNVAARFRSERRPRAVAANIIARAAEARIDYDE